jgi:23S rRNA pseudouridine2605 synthase
MDRLNKVLAAAGFGSRRQCEKLIVAGRVAVDGVPVTELGTRIGPEEKVAVDGKEVKRQRLVYWLVNKPKGYLSTNKDPGGRPRVIDLVPEADERIYTVGRLDEDSEGLVLLTNDGELALRLTHPRYGIEKTYHVQVAGKPTQELFEKLRQGVFLAEGKARAKRVKRLGFKGESALLEVVLAEGKNREIRRIFAKLGHKVMKLRRVAIGPISVQGLKLGKSRRLHSDELRALRRSAFPDRRNPVSPRNRVSDSDSSKDQA